MGYALGFSACVGCGRPFFYNPLRVPSIVVNGNREPVCLDCVNRANPVRRQAGLPEIVPHPDAYDGVNERELGDD